MALTAIVLIIGIGASASSMTATDTCADAAGKTCQSNVNEADSGDTSALLQGHTKVQATGPGNNVGLLSDDGKQFKTSCLGTPSEKQQLRGQVLDAVCQKLGKANFLVFGTGYDSPFWMKSNPHGHTRFLEHHNEWVSFQTKEVQNAETMVQFDSELNVSNSIEEIQNTSLLRRFYEEQIPDDIKNTQWDQILVDSPEGNGQSLPGRGRSIYAAKLLANANTVIFVDDCDREVELAYVKAHLASLPGRALTKLDNGHSADYLGDHKDGATCRISADGER